MCKATDTLQRLDESEKSALLNLNDGPIQKQMHPKCALKFMDLGLVELAQGRLARTPLGRRVTWILSSRNPAPAATWHRHWHQSAH